MTRDAMRRLRASNPVPDLPPLTPIALVIPDREAIGGREHTSPMRRVRTPRSSRRWGRAGSVLIAALSAAAAVVAVIALTTIHPAHRSPLASGGPGTYSNPEGWSVSHPAGFTVSSAPSGTAGLLSGGAQVTVSSFRPSRTVTGRLKPRTPLSPVNEPYATPLAQSGRFPADGVALILQPCRCGVLGPDSAFPIDVSQFGPAHAQPFFTKTVAVRDSIPPARNDEIVGYGDEVTATVLVGSRAPAALRTELDAVVRSLAFRRLAPGTELAGDSYLVGPASRFPVGSFTRIEARFATGKPTAVYLVHAPGRFAIGHQCPKLGSCTPTGAFYGMGETYHAEGNHAPNCQIQFDREDAQFYCTNLGVRWDRVGRVVKLPANEKYIGGIGGDYAKIAWDGQIMITPGWGPQESRAAVHLLWPDWHQPKHPNRL